MSSKHPDAVDPKQEMGLVNPMRPLLNVSMTVRGYSSDLKSGASS